MVKYATIIAWAGGALFTYLWLMKVGTLRDAGYGWKDSLILKNDLIFFGATGIFTMVAMLLASMQ